jgi:hypothetical protein
MRKPPQLLREYISFKQTPEVLKESMDKNNGLLILTGVIQRADAKNENGRIYPRKILEREVGNFQKAIRENRSIGELDHADEAVVSYTKASHVIREVWWNGNDVMGRVEIFNGPDEMGGTPCGRIAQSLLKRGINIGISSRGVGSTESMNEADVVLDDFNLLTWDLVATPSTHGAYLFGESKNFSVRTKFEKSDRIYRAINDIILPR